MIKNVSYKKCHLGFLGTQCNNNSEEYIQLVKKHLDQF